MNTVKKPFGSPKKKGVKNSAPHDLILPNQFVEPYTNLVESVTNKAQFLADCINTFKANPNRMELIEQDFIAYSGSGELVKVDRIRVNKDVIASIQKELIGAAIMAGHSCTIGQVLRQSIILSIINDRGEL